MDKENNLQESGASGAVLGWTSKDIPNENNPAKVAPGSSLTACTWVNGGDRNIRVFYQDLEGQMQQVVFDRDSWKRGQPPGK